MNTCQSLEGFEGKFLNQFSENCSKTLGRTPRELLKEKLFGKWLEEFLLKFLAELHHQENLSKDHSRISSMKDFFLDFLQGYTCEIHQEFWGFSMLFGNFFRTYPRILSKILESIIVRIPLGVVSIIVHGVLPRILPLLLLKIVPGFTPLIVHEFISIIQRFLFWFLQDFLQDFLPNILPGIISRTFVGYPNNISSNFVQVQQTFSLNKMITNRS